MTITVSVPGADILDVADTNGTWVVSDIVDEPVGTEIIGTSYLVAPLGRGSFSGYSDNVAILTATRGWIFIPPQEGLKAYVISTNASLVYDGTAWIASFDSLSMIKTPEAISSTVGTGGDDTAVLTQWAASIPSGGFGLLTGNYRLSDTITFAIASVYIHFTGSITPFVQPASQKAFFSIAASNVTIDGHGTGRINGLSSSYSKWDAVYAFGPAAATMGVSGYLLGPTVKGVNFSNLGLQNMSTAIIQFQATDKGLFANNTATNCGKTNAFLNVFGAFFFTGSYNRDLLIEGIIGETVGNIFINNSASLRTITRNCSVRNATLFAYKGGYGAVQAVSADVSPTTTTFSIANTVYSKSQFSPGMGFFNLSASTFPLPEGYVLTQEDFGSYIKITTTEPMSAAPGVGDNLMETETGSIYDRCQYAMSGMDGYDLNNSWDITVVNPYIRGAGLLKISGAYANFSSGVCCGIWLGADLINGNTNIRTKNITITGADVADCYGSGIQVEGACTDVVITDYRIRNIGVVTDASPSVAPTSWGISTNKFSTNSASNVNVGAGSIVTAQGGALYSAFSQNDSIRGVNASAPVGINLFEQSLTKVSNNTVTATSTLANTFGYQVSSAGAVSSTLLFSDNFAFLPATSFASGTGTGYGVLVSDTSATGIYIQPGNRLISDTAGGSPGFTTVGGAGVAGVVYTNQSLP